MSFLTILFALLGFPVEAQTDQDGAMVGGSAQGGTQTEIGGVIIVGG